MDEYYYMRGGIGYLLYRGNQCVWEAAHWCEMRDYLRANGIVAHLEQLRIIVLN